MKNLSTNGYRLYAIGDIHGKLDLLEALLKKIREDLVYTTLPVQTVFLGDYIDRGPHSAQVIELFLDGQLDDLNPVYLKGNHEQFLIRSTGDESQNINLSEQKELLDIWLYNGGLETLRSYNLETYDLDMGELLEVLNTDFPKDHLAFYGSLLSFYEQGDYYFAHAGVRPGIPLKKQEDRDLLWIRSLFLDCEKDFGKIIVHGHTPSRGPQLLPNRIGIDTGACFGNALTAVRLETGEKPVFLSAEA